MSFPAAEPDPRRRIPGTDVLLAAPALAESIAVLGRAMVKDALAAAQAEARAGLIAPEDIVDVARAALPGAPTTTAAVLNATGVVLHTNLGRAALSTGARAAVTLAAGHTDVELDLATGARSRRGRGALDALAAAVPEAESVHVVNNGAAALALAAVVLAGAGGNIVLSRGEMVEIGDGFRIPELLEATGVDLREVGTTNRVRREDYARAIDERTGFVLKVHPSNFVVSGFTSTVSVAELADLPVPVVADIGSGLLRAHRALPDEPDAATTLAAGAALVTASGDKLLGGPQAGLMLGRADLIERLRRHPLARAVRVDKLTLAGLEATVRGPQTPTEAALTADPAVLRTRAAALAAAVMAAVPGVAEALTVTESAGAVGGGAGPQVALPGYAVAVPAHWAAPLRAAAPPVLARIRDGHCLIDLRAIDPADEDRLTAAVVAVARAHGSGTTDAPAPKRG